MKVFATFLALLLLSHGGAQINTPAVTVKDIIEMQKADDKTFDALAAKFGLQFLSKQNDTLPGRAILVFSNAAFSTDSNKSVIEIDRIIDTLHFSRVDVNMVTIAVKTYSYTTFKRLFTECMKSPYNFNNARAYGNLTRLQGEIASAGMSFEPVNQPGNNPCYIIEEWQGPR